MEENSDNCVDKEPYRILHSVISPLCSRGRKRVSIWQGADCISDFYNVQAASESQTKIEFSMMFDDDALYAVVSCGTPDAYAPVVAGADMFKTTHIELYVAMGQSGDGTLRICIDEAGNRVVRINGEEREPQELKHVVSHKERKGFRVWETTLRIPFEILGRPSPQDGEGLRCTVIHSRHYPIWERFKEVSVCDYPAEEPGDCMHWRQAQFVRQAFKGRRYSAIAQIRQKFGHGQVTLSPETASGVYTNKLGINNSPRIKAAAGAKLEKELFKRLGPARVRHHDAALCDGGYALVDVSRIFPLFRADHHDPENYDFAPTDACFKYVQECGVPIEFRFGECIEHSEEKFRVKPPSDPQKWAEICVNILRHYNEGWANGMYLNIEYVSAWEEPDGITNLFIGPYEQYLELYRCFATEMRAAFPTVKIGGPQAIYIEKIEEFVRYCREQNLPLDFISTTHYRRTPQAFNDKLLPMRQLAEKYGYPNAELFMSEWHYWTRGGTGPYSDDRLTMENASFTVASMICMQETVDMAYYYIWASVGYYGLFSSPSDPYKVYYALCLYTEFIRKQGRKVEVDACCKLPGVYSLASVDGQGTVHVLLSKFKSAVDSIAFTLPSAYEECSMKRVSDESPRGEKESVFSRNSDGCIDVDISDRGHGVYLLEFRKTK